MTRIAEPSDIYPVFHELFAKQSRNRQRLTGDSIEQRSRQSAGLLFESSDWNFDTLSRTYDAIEEVALEDMRLDVYPNQMEIISSEQMLDAYSSIGLPLMYRHWSFGKHFVHEETALPEGPAGASPTNSSSTPIPASATCMEENTMAMQALVMAHAAFGHNHFFKNNYLFRQWTDAEGILDYLEFAKRYIARCEERHGLAAVEMHPRCRPCADGPGRVPLSPAAAPVFGARAGTACASGWNTRRRPSTTCGAPCRSARRAKTRPRRKARRRSASARSSCRKRTCSISSRRTA